MLGVAEGLTEVFARVDTRGRYVYSADEVRGALVGLILQAGLDVRALPPALDKILNDFLSRLPLSSGADRTAVAAAIRAYYQQHPINPKLLAELQRVFSAASGEAAADLAGALAKAGAAIDASRGRQHQPLPAIPTRRRPPKKPG
jgi:hypothetical protein